LKGKTPLEIGRIICEQEAEAPSRTIDPAGRGPGDAIRTLQGDLDHIVLAVMRKRPSHRYASVAALSRDVAAYLNEEPLETRIYTRAQRVRQFVRRHNIAVVAILLMILALTGLVIGMAMNTRHPSQKIGVSTLISCELTTS